MKQIFETQLNIQANMLINCLHCTILLILIWFSTWSPVSHRESRHQQNMHDQERWSDAFLADRTATQYDRLLAAACCPSVCL